MEREREKESNFVKMSVTTEYCNSVISSLKMFRVREGQRERVRDKKDIGRERARATKRRREMRRAVTEERQ